MKESIRKTILIFGLLIVVGCTPTEHSIVIGETEISATNNDMTSSPTPSFTQTPSQTMQVTGVTTNTFEPVSTLSEQNARDEILTNLSTNKECSFPCWWGITPGFTPISDILVDLERYKAIWASQPSEYRGRMSYHMRVPFQEDSFISLRMTIYPNIDRLEWLTVSIVMEKKTDANSYEISWNDPYLSGVTQNLSVAQILSDYGRPPEILLYTHQAVMMGDPWPFSVVLFYPQYGFMVEYTSDVETVDGGEIVGCLSNAFYVFWFWPPSETLSFEEVVQLSSGYELRYEGYIRGWRDLDVATDMTIDSFYRAFQDSSSEPCIRTPQELWPLPGE